MKTIRKSRIEETINSLKKTARVAGMLYIIMGACLIFRGMYVDPKLYVPGRAVVMIGPDGEDQLSFSTLQQAAARKFLVIGRSGRVIRLLKR